jgi:hypothetical protein
MKALSRGGIGMTGNGQVNRYAVHHAGSATTAFARPEAQTSMSERCQENNGLLSCERDGKPLVASPYRLGTPIDC